MYEKNSKRIVSDFIYIYNLKNPNKTIDNFDYSINCPDYGMFAIYSKKSKNTLYLKLLLSKPNTFIGRGNENINFFKKEFAKIYNVNNVKFNLIEYKLIQNNKRKYDSILGKIKVKLLRNF